VRQLQELLHQHGHYGGAIDGDFGPSTEAALQAFQHHYSLTADGVCGEKTWEMLARVYAE